MSISRVILICLLSSPLAGYAQSGDPTPAPHFYGGLGLYTSSHQNLGSWGNDGARIPVQALVGYQLRPRLAVQLGFAYSGNHYSYDYQRDYTSFGIVAYPVGTSTERNTTTSVLARYTLTRKLQHRFQADLLGGAKFEYSAYRDKGTYFDNRPTTPTVTPYDNSSTYTSTLLSIGPSLRYRVVSRLEVVYDLTFDFPVIGGKYSDNIYSSNRRSQATMALGLRYHFGPS